MRTPWRIAEQKRDKYTVTVTPTETREYDEDGHVTYQETFHPNGKSAHSKVIDPEGKTVIEAYQDDDGEITEIIEYWRGTNVVKSRKKIVEHEYKQWTTTYDENGNEENTTYTEIDQVTRVQKIEVSDSKTHKVIIRKWVNMDEEDEGVTVTVHLTVDLMGFPRRSPSSGKTLAP